MCHDSPFLTYLMFGFHQMSWNPIQNAGCYAILKSVQENPDSAMESLDFSVQSTHILTAWDFNFLLLNLFSLLCMCHHFQDIRVNQEFEDLYAAMKKDSPALTVNHGSRTGTFRKAKA